MKLDELKAEAYKQVRRAIKDGRLVRPETCQTCKRIPPLMRDGRSQIQAHHPDYTKPIDVEWLCSKCHRAETPLPEVIGAPVFGEQNGQAKLTEVDVIAQRRLRTKGLSYQAIADRFGVDKKTAMRAIKGERWGHVVDNDQQPVTPSGALADNDGGVE